MVTLSAKFLLAIFQSHIEDYFRDSLTYMPESQLSAKLFSQLESNVWYVIAQQLYRGNENSLPMQECKQHTENFRFFIERQTEWRIQAKVFKTPNFCPKKLNIFTQLTFPTSLNILNKFMIFLLLDRCE